MAGAMAGGATCTKFFDEGPFRQVEVGYVVVLDEIGASTATQPPSRSRTTSFWRVVGWRWRPETLIGRDSASWIIVRMNAVGAIRSTTDPAIGVPSSSVAPSARTWSTTSVVTRPPPSLMRPVSASAR